MNCISYRLLLTCILSSFFMSSTHALDDVSSTFMYTKPITNALSIEHSSWYNIVYDKQASGGAFQLYGYAQNSFTTTKSSAYFLFDNKEKLRITPSQDLTRKSPYHDIAGQWFGLAKTDSFDEAFSFTPEQSQVGTTLEYNQNLDIFSDIAFLKNLSVGIALPVTYVRNKLNFTGSKATYDLLNRPNQHWYFIPKHNETSSTKIANATLYLASKYMNKHDMIVATKTFVILPATHEQDPRHIFSPQQGFNGHIVWGSQVTWQFPIVKKTDDAIDRFCWFFTLENKHFFKNNQYRTLDLKNKPYSRYMRLYDDFKQQEVLAMNVLTKECEIRPYNHINFVTGLRFKYKYSTAEIGYELYGHPDEELEIKYTNPWEENRYGIAHVQDDGTFNPTAAGVKTATINSTINTIIPDSANTYIRKKDINMLSGASRSAIKHRAFGSATFAHKGNTVTTAATFGAFIEGSQSNTALSTWGGWIKISASF